MDISFEVWSKIAREAELCIGRATRMHAVKTMRSPQIKLSDGTQNLEAERLLLLAYHYKNHDLIIVQSNIIQ